MWFLKAREQEVLRLEEHLGLRRVRPPNPLTPAARRELEQARQRCRQCDFKGPCDEGLSAGDLRALSFFCPNGRYFARLRAADPQAR